MNKEVFEITNKLMNFLMETKGCKIAEVSVVPDGDPNISIRTHVTIKFSYYEGEYKNDNIPKREIKWHKCSEDCFAGELNLAAFDGIENDPDYQKGSTFLDQRNEEIVKDRFKKEGIDLG